MLCLGLQGRDQVENPTRHTFTQSLSGEVRNLVYDILFRRPNPILLHNVRAYHAQQPTRTQYPDPDDFRVAMIEFRTVYADETGADEEFRHGLGEGIAFLQTCRQINHEAAGVLYGRNNFLFSRVLTCNHMDHGDNVHDTKAYHQFNYTACWLSDIGSNFRYLAKVSIDISAICPNTTECDVLPLLKLLWYQKDRNCSIQFVTTGREVKFLCSCQGYEGDDNHNDTSGAETLSALLWQLRAYTCILRQYAFSAQLLESVTITMRGKVVVLFYGSPTPQSFCPASNMLQTRSSLLGTDVSCGLGLLDLPISVHETIIERALQAMPEITINLDTQTLHGFPIYALHINRKLRYSDSFLLKILSGHSVILRTCIVATTPDPSKLAVVGDVENLALIKKILDSPYSVRNTLARIIRSPNLNVQLQIGCRHSCAARHLEINVVGLLSLLRRDSATTLAHLSITFTSPRGSVYFTETTHYQFQVVARVMFLLLVDLLESAKLATKKQPWKLQIWMNGQGKLLRADLVTSNGQIVTTGNRHCALRDEEVRQRGYERAWDLEQGMTSVHTSEGNLRAICCDLRHIFWDDWKDH